MLEQAIEKYLIKQIKLLGGHTRKVQWIGNRGAPDRLVMINGKAYWIELKSPGKFPTPLQVLEHNILKNNGQVVLIIDSLKGVDDFINTI